MENRLFFLGGGGGNFESYKTIQTSLEKIHVYHTHKIMGMVFELFDFQISRDMSGIKAL
jgi:hypothetical protein